MHTKKRREFDSSGFPVSPFCLAKKWKFFFFDVLMNAAFTAWFVPSSTNSPFDCSKTAKLREPPVLETGPSQPFLTRFTGHGKFEVAPACFRA